MTFPFTRESVLNAFSSGERMAEMCGEISQDLVKNKYDISSFVESLGFALSSPEVELRVNGTKLLSQTLAELPPGYLNAAQLDFIVTFYCDRLKDHHNVIPAIIEGMMSLVQMENLKEGVVGRIVTTFFQHVSCQSQNREDREKIYAFLRLLSEKHSLELKAMGANYVYNIISAIDGERDPRNLVFLFDFMPGFIKKYPLHHLSEEMFETFACYFPVDFQPLKDDPKSISREVLAGKLSNCLVASEEFAGWVVPLALEKLESDLIVAKLDSLKLISRCAESFTSELIEEHFNDIWTHLKCEILPGSGNDAIIEAGFSTLDAILRKVAENPQASKNVQVMILSNILPYVSNTNHHLFAAAFRIAHLCVASDPVFAGEKVLGAVALELKENETSDEKKIKLLAKAHNILATCASKEAFSKIEPPILEQIQKVLLECLQTTDSELAGIAWVNIENSLGIFTAEQRDELYRKLIEALCDDKIVKDLSVVILKYARMYPDEISLKVIDNICNNCAELAANTKRNLYLNIVALVQIPKYEEKIQNLITKPLSESGSDEEIAITLLALRKLLETDVESTLAYRIWCHCDILNSFHRLVHIRQFDKDILLQMSAVIRLFVRKLSIENQQNIVDEYMKVLDPENPSDIFIMQGFLGHISEKVSLQSYFSELVSRLVNTCLNIEDETTRSVAHLLLCSLVNRIDQTENNNNTLRAAFTFLRHEIKEGRWLAIETLAWIGKGLIVRGHEQSGELIEDISQLLDHPTLCKAAEFAFDIISAEVPELHLPAVKFLYKQKTFHTVLNKIWEKLVKFEEGHINAFASVLGMVPHPVLKVYLEKILPIIFKSLDTSKAKTVRIMLGVIKEFLLERDEYLQRHFNHLIPQLLKLSARKDSMSLRIVALENLEIISKFPSFTVQPYRVDVVLGLATSLDDKKRLVRNAAVRTRNAWFLIGTENSDGK